MLDGVRRDGDGVFTWEPNSLVCQLCYTLRRNCELAI